MGKYQPGQDLEMMQDPDEWPIWPQLPLKRRRPEGRRKDEPMSGFLVAIPELEPVVYLGIVGTVVAERPRTVYPSFQAILDDGWLVD